MVTDQQVVLLRKKLMEGKSQQGNVTTATTWQDNHNGYRRHKLMTKELGDTIPPLYANDGADDPDGVVARVKLFSPYNGWRWYITEWDPETGLCFGLVEGSNQNSDTSTSPSWRRSRCSAASPPWSETCTGSR